MQIKRFTVAVLSFLFAFSLFANDTTARFAERNHVDPLGHSGTPWLDEQGVMRSGGVCASRHYSPEEVNVIETEHMRDLMTGRVGIRTNFVAPATISVHFYVITDGKNGKVTAAAINNTIAKMNAIYAGGEGGVNTGIQFAWTNAVNGQPVTYTNRSWYSAKPGSAAEAEMKQTISSQPGNSSLNHLNIYTNSPGVYYGGTLLGWATFPWELAGAPLMDGVVMNHIALNYGGTTSYNGGDVVAHEVGHWLGLYHTFQGGCTGSTAYDGTVGLGDLVDDTTPEASSASGCPTGRDTCAGGAVDPIDNYMDYSSNACQIRFTAGQNVRIGLKSGLRSGL
ncbi:MAG TPA: zinc metalloprotease [Thermoanaerobaculia bacterium]